MSSKLTTTNRKIDLVYSVPVGKERIKVLLGIAKENELPELRRLYVNQSMEERRAISEMLEELFILYVGTSPTRKVLLLTTTVLVNENPMFPQRDIPKLFSLLADYDEKALRFGQGLLTLKSALKIYYSKFDKFGVELNRQIN